MCESSFKALEMIFDAMKITLQKYLSRLKSRKIFYLVGNVILNKEKNLTKVL